VLYNIFTTPPLHTCVRLLGGSASDGPSTSYRSNQASSRVPLRDRGHGGGEDHRESRPEAVLGCSSDSAGQTRRTKHKLVQGFFPQHFCVTMLIYVFACMDMHEYRLFFLLIHSHFITIIIIIIIYA
jgi:hypothetical protein